MKKELDKIEMYTDGACSGNPGPGGWGTILRFGSAEKELSGGERSTTNNRMELTAVIEGFKALKRPCDVTLYTDSKYVADAITKGWAEGWKRKGWNILLILNSCMEWVCLHLKRMMQSILYWRQDLEGGWMRLIPSSIRS